ncbi:hypothetical protein [Nocardioides guangzhouensis]|uniref:hypothetical protein n=1 Tax=Nocardioides guangzhouensis TaxID=2497878 RepID=UPI00158DC03A|nr:hypothetical protein [Nocardioides guangzhouensis]
MLLRTMAVAASSRVDAVELATVEEKVAEALECLGKVDDLKTVAARIGKDAEKVGLQATSAATTIRRLLTEAQTSLSGAVATDAGAGAGASKQEAPRRHSRANRYCLSRSGRVKLHSGYTEGSPKLNS